MGWKVVLRSMAAEERRRHRSTQKQLDALDRAGRGVDRLSGRLDDELVRDLEDSLSSGH